MKKLPFIEQMEHSECGLACLAMILGYYGHHISLSELREEFGVPKGGFSFFNLSEISRMYNLDSKAFKGGETFFKQNKSPTILFWKKKHFVVLEKYNNKKYTIIDPAVGRRVVSEEDFKKSYSNFFLTFSISDKFQKRKKPNHFLFLSSYIPKQPNIILSILVISLILQSLVIAIPLLTRWVMDNILPSGDIHKLNTLGIFIVTIIVAYLLLNFVRSFTIAKLQTNMDKKMMSHFMEHLLHLPYKFFENRSNGDLLFRANSHVYIRQVLSTKLITFFIDTILLFSYAFLMIRLSPKLGIVVIGVGIVLFLFLILSTRTTHRITNEDVNNQSQVQKLLSESIYGISDIKAMGLEEKFFNEWKGEFNKQLHSSQARSVWNSTLSLIPSTIQFSLPIITLWIGGYSVIHDDISVGTLVAFNTLALSFVGPVSSIGLGYGEIISLKSYIQKIYDVVKSNSEFGNQKRAKVLLTGEIEFKNVSFRYDYFSEDVIKNLSFKIKIGEKVAIVGNSGSGKSTIAKLLLGLYVPTEGEILYNQISTSQLDMKYVRNQIGTLLQETSLFNRPILENINMQGLQIPNEHVLFTCDRADILKDILSSPLGFQTTISEMGANFSGGQKQRIALARALLKEPPILILDEATSSLDNVSERKIDKNISNLKCTRIIIAHRLSTIRTADRILVLDKGDIVEEGNHEQLINKQGHYFNLYNAYNTKREQSVL